MPGHPPGPGLVESDAVDGGHEVDAVWRNAQLNDPAGGEEVVDGQAETAESEVRECIEQPRRVSGDGSTSRSRSLVNRGLA